MKKSVLKNHIKDVIHTIVIALAIVLFWRGVWGLADLYLFPENKLLSYSISIIIGILILYEAKSFRDKLL